jgi:flagellar basal body-associated protein FliL
MMAKAKDQTLDEPEEGKSSKIWLIVVIVLIVLCCLCLIAAGAAWWLWNNGDRLLGISRLLVASGMI